MATSLTPASLPTLDQASPIWGHFLWRNHSEKCIPIQMHSPEKVDQSEYQVLFTILYVSVWLSAILGNLCVIYVVTLKQVSLSSVRSVFIVSLAANDIVMSVTSLPITAVSIFTRDWVFPGLFCKLMGLFQGGSVFVSSFTLTAIAVDRYFLISHPASKKVNFRKAVGSVVAIWVAGYFFSLPVAMFSTTETYRPICGQFCEELWPDADENGVSQMRKVYGALVLTVQFGLPVAISSLCYWAIGQIIQRQVQKRKEQQILDRDIESRLETRKSRSNRMMISMVFFMVLAWLPMNLINLWRDFDASEGVSEWYSLIFAACHVVAMTSAVWNCVIYSWFNPCFKDTLKRAITQRKQSTPRKYSSLSRRPISRAVPSTTS